MTTFRRLMSPRDVAKDKIKRSHDWFIKNRQKLYEAGFPRPILGDGPKQRALYDPAAIDAWFDMRMPAHLRQNREAIRDTVVQAITVNDALLERRLQEAA